MVNKVKVDIVIDDKGTLKKVKKDTDKAGKAADNYSKKQKGVAGATSNSTKAFSKMASGTGGLVAAYATLAANIFAISAAFQFLKTAGNLEALSKSQAAIGRAAGLNSDQLEGLAKAAKNASTALGRDTADAFQRLTRGAIKAEPELLDELGIIIRLDKVTSDYKDTLNIVGRELTAFERTQAVVNATLDQANNKFEDVGNNVNQIAKLGKSFNDLVKQLQKGLIGPANFIADVFIKNILGLAGAFAILGVQLIKALAPAGPQLGNLAGLAVAAKTRLSGAAGTGTKAGASISAGNFGAVEMRAIETASKAKSSKVILHSKLEKQAIKRDLALIRADHARVMAANSTGFAKYVKTSIANLKMLQAEHGMVMGTMKGAVGGFASFAGKALNAIAIIGFLTLAISMAKELLALAKSDAAKALEARATELKNRFSEQNEEVEKLRNTLKLSNTEMGKLIQFANLASNISLVLLNHCRLFVNSIL